VLLHGVPQWWSMRFGGRYNLSCDHSRCAKLHTCVCKHTPVFHADGHPHRGPHSPQSTAKQRDATWPLEGVFCMKEHSRKPIRPKEGPLASQSKAGDHSAWQRFWLERAAHIRKHTRMAKGPWRAECSAEAQPCRHAHCPRGL